MLIESKLIIYFDIYSLIGSEEVFKVISDIIDKFFTIPTT